MDTVQKSFLERFLFLLGCAIVIAFYSEFFFFNEGPVDDLNAVIGQPHILAFKLFELSLWYVLAIAPAILIMYFTKVSNIWGMFLAGSIAGYCIEGLIVPVVYIELPISLLWTSLSWHPIVDVLFGLWLWQYWLRNKSFIFNLCVCSLLGVIWAVWTTWPIGHISDTTSEIVGFTPLKEYIVFLFSTTCFLFVGNILLALGSKKKFNPTKVDYRVFAATSAVLFVLMIFLVSFIALLLPVLIGLLYLPLHLSRSIEKDGRQPILNMFEKSPSYFNHLSIWAMPIFASLTYWGLTQFDIHITYWIIGWPMIILGLIYVILSPLNLLRPKKQSDDVGA